RQRTGRGQTGIRRPEAMEVRVHRLHRSIMHQERLSCTTDIFVCLNVHMCTIAPLFFSCLHFLLASRLQEFSVSLQNVCKNEFSCCNQRNATICTKHEPSQSENVVTG